MTSRQVLESVLEHVPDLFQRELNLSQTEPDEIVGLVVSRVFDLIDSSVELIYCLLECWFSLIGWLTLSRSHQVTYFVEERCRFRRQLWLSLDYRDSWRWPNRHRQSSQRLQRTFVYGVAIPPGKVTPVASVRNQEENPEARDDCDDNGPRSHRC